MKNKNIYLVWISGIIDYKGNNLSMAQAAYESWRLLGYKDVKLEIIEGL